MMKDVQILEVSTKHRRYLHSIPELGFKEYKTSEYIENTMKKLGYNVERCLETGLICTQNFIKGRKTIAFRAEMDALKIQEQNILDYSSKHEGMMHACGHDGHMAIMLTLAEYISVKDLDLNIVFIFQPAEEGYAGAKKLIETGALDKYEINEIYAGHLVTKYQVGKIVSCYDKFWAGTCEFEIKLKGKGGHAAYPHISDDLNLIGSQLVVNIYSSFHRKIDPRDAVVLSIGKIRGGSQFNVLPDTFEIAGTLRAFDKENMDRMKETINSYVKGYCDIHNIDCKFISLSEYLPVINTPEMVKKLEKACKKSKNNFEIGNIEMTGEDFSFFLDKYKGAFFWIGAGFKDGNNYSLHNPNFNFNEVAMVAAVKVFYNLLKISE